MYSSFLKKFIFFNKKPYNNLNFFFFNNFWYIFTILINLKNKKNILKLQFVNNSFFKNKNKNLNKFYIKIINKTKKIIKKNNFLKKKLKLKFTKYKTYNFFLYSYFFKNKPYKLWINKYNSFWPIFNKLKIFLNLRKKLNKAYARKFKKLLILMRKSKKKTFNNNILVFLKKNKSFFLKKKVYFKKFINNKLKKKKKKIFLRKYKKKRSKFCNMHRRQIKLFWKSQIFFKNFFFEKKRWTTRKFKNKFLYWYKKNKFYSFPILKKIELWKILLKFNIFLTKKDIKFSLLNNLVFVNGELPKKGFETIILENDIITFYLNYVYVRNFIKKKKFLYKKKLKKLNYIYISNKKSQWRSLKKKKPEELHINFSQKFSISKMYEFDIFTASFCYFQKISNKSLLDYYTPRHNLDKLNIYKLNV